MSHKVVIAAFNEEQTAQLTGVSLRQLRYWKKTDFLTPSLKDAETRAVRLYSFRDLVSLKVLNTLRNEINVALPHLREVKERLIHMGDDVWAKTTLYILNRRVAIKNPETQQMEDAASQQGILQIPLLVVQGDMKDAIEASQRRSEAVAGRIEKHRGIARGKPVIAGTRIPVSAVKAFAEAGYSVKKIQEQYPTLTDADVRAALEFGTAA